MDYLIDAIKQVTEDGGNGNFCIVHLNDDYYLQFTGQNGSKEVYCEAVSNQFLEKSQQLTTDQQQQLLDLGWDTPDFGNYSRNCSVRSSEDLIKTVQFLMDTAKKVYQTAITEDTEYTIELE